jgi:hypothetical protein
LFNAILLDPADSLVWAIIAQIAEHTQWIVDERPRDSLCIFMVLIREPANRPRAYAIRPYFGLLALAAALADDEVLTAIPFVVGEGTVTEDAIRDFHNCRFWNAYFQNAIKSSSANVQRSAMYLVALCWRVPYLEMFERYILRIVNWIQDPELCPEVVQFIADCSGCSPLAAKMCQQGFVEYFEGMKGDSIFGEMADRFLAKVQGSG